MRSVIQGLQNASKKHRYWGSKPKICAGWSEGAACKTKELNEILISITVVQVAAKLHHIDFSDMSQGQNFGMSNNKSTDFPTSYFKKKKLDKHTTAERRQTQLNELKQV